VFPDGCFPCSWNIDIHTPHPDFDNGLKGQEFISQATTGKDTNIASPIGRRIARSTAGTSRTSSWPGVTSASTARASPGAGHADLRDDGEVVGKAAWICIRHGPPSRCV